ncbi:T9SS type A sorting domain-containing protein, partial [candidate division KSB1 bacterium]|nr:T9SS type A sorting domain-containing protein [candidate division KSB1 bacterium]
QTVGEQYVPIYPTGTQKLEEKQGYWLAALQDCQLSLPGASGLAKNKTVSAQDYDNFVQTFGAEPPPPPFLTGLSTGMIQPVKELSSRHFPNPFNPVITIEYQLPENGEISIRIYNNLGQIVRQLVQDYQTAGKHQIIWDARNEVGDEVSNGIYLYQIMHNGNSLTRKIMYLK